jgi:hypothetical protein
MTTTTLSIEALITAHDYVTTDNILNLAKALDDKYKAIAANREACKRLANYYVDVAAKFDGLYNEANDPLVASHYLVCSTHALDIAVALNNSLSVQGDMYTATFQAFHEFVDNAISLFVKETTVKTHPTVKLMRNILNSAITFGLASVIIARIFVLVAKQQICKIRNVEFHENPARLQRFIVWLLAWKVENAKKGGISDDKIAKFEVLHEAAKSLL